MKIVYYVSFFLFLFFVRFKKKKLKFQFKYRPGLTQIKFYLKQSTPIQTYVHGY